MNDTQFCIDNFITMPVMLYMHNVSLALDGGDKKSVTMIAGILPSNCLPDHPEKGRDIQKVVHGSMLLTPNLQIPAIGYHGWRIDTILTDTNWVRGGLTVDEFKKKHKGERYGSM